MTNKRNLLRLDFEQGTIYWDSLTPKQKFEWEYLDIDPTEPPKVITGIDVYCSNHFEPVKECKYVRYERKRNV